MNGLIRVKLKEITNSQDIIKKDNLHYKSKNRKVYNFSKHFLPILLRGIFFLFQVTESIVCSKRFNQRYAS